MSTKRFPQDLMSDLLGIPQRAVTSLNIEMDLKQQFDFLHAWWELETGQAISQPDAVRILLAAAIDNPRVSRPPGWPVPMV
jgi:hypothetical protein